MTRILVLGGTTEASQLAHLLANAGIDAIFSYAGRTKTPIKQPLPLRIGGFGGAEGLGAYLRAESISHLVDATHPFAAQISANAITACEAAGTQLLALERPEWRAQAGDRWINVKNFQEAAGALPTEPVRVFLAIGRQNLEYFSNLPHRWLLRLVNVPDKQMPLANADIVIARGPFTADGDEALLREHRITYIIAKNSGGTGGEAKLVAARRLSLPVLMIDRPAVPTRPVASTPEEVMDWLHQSFAPDRGV